MDYGRPVLKRTYDEQRCSVARTLEVVGERWTFLIVRDALLGTTRFDGFLSNLDVSRNTLTVRLKYLVEKGVLERTPYQSRPVRFEYRLTTKGRELAPVIVALMDWGDRYAAVETGPPRVAEHIGCDGSVHAELRCTDCDRQLRPGEVRVRLAQGDVHLGA